MRRFILALSLIAPVAAGVTPARAAAGSAAEKAVLATLESWKEATMKKDKALFEKVYHPELTYGHSSGMIETKAEAIEHVVGNPNSVYEEITISEPKVKVVGSLALVNAKLFMKMKGRDAANLVALIVFTKTPKGWQMIGRHTTRAPAPGAASAPAKPAGAAATPTAQTPPPAPSAPAK
jgi:ketosteroid isomerase-like protein